jgi:hypothetical protein
MFLNFIWPKCGSQVQAKINFIFDQPYFICYQPSKEFLYHSQQAQSPPC